MEEKKVEPNKKEETKVNKTSKLNPNLKKYIILAGAGLVLIIMIVVSTFYFKRSFDNKKMAKLKKEQEGQKLIQLSELVQSKKFWIEEDVIVLNDFRNIRIESVENTNTYIDISIAIKFKNETTKLLIERQKIDLEKSILRFMGLEKEKNLRTLEDKIILKQKLVDHINNYLGYKGVKEVYLTYYLIY